MLLKNVKVIRPKTTKIQKRNGIGYVYQVIGKSYKKDKKWLNRYIGDLLI